MFISPVLAQDASVAVNSAAVSGNPLRILLQFLIIFIVFYFFLIRPQNKKMREHVNMQSTIARGDTIITNGGIVGKVIRSNMDDLLVEIADGVRVVVLRDHVLAKRKEPVEISKEDASANDNGKKDSEGLKDLLTKKGK
ncbi:MAG: preprotein translocase subunit YajC [Alphaproteobacteria bacterium]|nr:preprotein translocase subunit YajC [Alphaproteobacteria bacterium]